MPTSPFFISDVQSTFHVNFVKFCELCHDSDHLTAVYRTVFLLMISILSASLWSMLTKNELNASAIVALFVVILPLTEIFLIFVSFYLNCSVFAKYFAMSFLCQCKMHCVSSFYWSYYSISYPFIHFVFYVFLTLQISSDLFTLTSSIILMNIL